ncbi:hypothetical protein P691DRAFT_800280 [Macrolepiota fuliginosa MF-IS2]|uniref:Uncharacterized protein n=1 Tax=Macrolepiota fuliginosa MF-IS2 TaxID=1400762 RepID=A0A9P6C4H6_9AGAR|nr:hypothetical protein P691DRAFT_800280 [Macrolepiota fuliginosa MF-IS2]
MAVTLEICRNIVNEISSRSDLAILCQVGRGFRSFAERALYNTLYMRNFRESFLLSRTLSTTKRIASLVDALTIYTTAEDEAVSEDSDSEEEESNHDLPDEYWGYIAQALEHTTNLRYLNMHVANSANANAAWTLDNCSFQLKGFHCDLNWDKHLVSFLNKQVKLNDLYLLDYVDVSGPSTPTTSAPNPEESSASLLPSAFPNLSTLECTFSEAAVVIVPHRPITRLKICFSRTQLPEKREEMTLLMSKIRQSTRSLRSLDIADSEYTTSFSMELLSSIVNSRATSSELRYLGTLVLPISGRERLQFYGLLMRLPRIQCIEVEVSDWVPPPSTPPAFRALASEMRLYTPTVLRVVFVHNFDRTVVTVVDGVCRMDNDANHELLWRET